MKKALRMFAGILMVAALSMWLALGANRGWTKTSVPRKTLDPVTGIEGISYESKFVPGVDLLAAAAVVSALLGGASLLFRNK
jgi:hypothetical protein